jgi:branched-chain amino acid transport system substrate-binding protein
MKLLKSLWFWLVAIAIILALVVWVTKKEKSTTEPTASVTQTDTQAKDQTTQLSDQNAQYFPLQSYRVGPYAAGGTGFFGGFIDYLKAVNAEVSME